MRPVPRGCPLSITHRLQETGALSRRLFLQLQRRPTSLVVGLLQPILWLVLFGALFSNAPATGLPAGMGYGRFLAAGVIVFTAFGAALNAGLPLMFDREFGFLNRLLVAPLHSRSSIVLATVINIASVTLAQCLVIVVLAGLMGYGWPQGFTLPVVLLTLLLLITAMTSLSVGLAFALPGHVELLAVTLLLNLPLLFSSTALAPMRFMPPWLAWIAGLNPLTFAIEPIRAAYAGSWSFAGPVLQAPYGNVSGFGCLFVLTLFAFAMLLLIRPLLRRKLA